MGATCIVVRGGAVGLIPDKIDSYYREGKESERLANWWGELERVRTQLILSRYLPPAPAQIFDIGGGAGVYAFPLAEQGYEVHLVDPVELHLEQASARAKERGVALASVKQGDARRLDIPANSADAVLMLGPLYHLVERADREEALLEAYRILRPGGPVFAVGISRFASLLDGMSRGFFRDAEFREIVDGDLQSGQHRNPTGNFDYFTTAYFHRPEELCGEVSGAGFAGVEVLAIEGPAWNAKFFLEAWRDEALRRALLEFLTMVEREPSLVGASAHLMAVGRRPR